MEAALLDEHAAGLAHQLAHVYLGARARSGVVRLGGSSLHLYKYSFLHKGTRAKLSIPKKKKTNGLIGSLELISVRGFCMIFWGVNE